MLSSYEKFFDDPDPLTTYYTVTLPPRAYLGISTPLIPFYFYALTNFLYSRAMYITIGQLNTVTTVHIPRQSTEPFQYATLQISMLLLVADKQKDYLKIGQPYHRHVLIVSL